MRTAFKSAFLTVLFAFLFVSSAFAVRDYGPVYSEYPTEKFIVGIGETFMTENSLMDNRVAEIRARLAIARQVNLRLGEETIEIMCDGSTGKLFKDWLECRSAFRSVIDDMVEMFKQGSTVVSTGQENGIVYAVAVLPRLKAAREMNISLKDALDRTIGAIERAKGGDMRYLWKAREEYVKVLTYAKEKEIIEGKSEYDREFFNRLENEILEIKESY
jgi:hypothetical protein